MGYLGYRAVLIFSLVCEVVALGMFAHQWFIPSSKSMAIPFFFLLVGVLGIFVGMALRDLSDRVAKVEAAEQGESESESLSGGRT